MRIVVAGATGFVGSALLADLSRDHRVIGLTRRAVEDGEAPVDAPGISWRGCDLFSALDTERALEGAEVGVYLIHSMLPSARLTQGSFADLDLILADNFARAASRARLKRIIYLGGLIPDDPDLSEHLSSRLEVERTFRAGPVPLVALRAGLVIGREGSSFRMVEKLSRRLPLMLTPSWTRSPTQPVALADVVALVRACLDRPGIDDRSFDVAGPDVVTYSELIARTGRALGHERKLLPVPFFSPNLSILWVSLVTGAPRQLVAPLVQSLRHRMVTDQNHVQELLGTPGTPLDVALRIALEQGRPGRARSTRRTLSLAARSPAEESTVRSVQRLPMPAGWNAARVAQEYLAWLPRFFAPLLRVETEGSQTRFLLWPFRRPLLTLTYVPERSTEDRQLFFITGGLLAHVAGRGARGRLEFREVLSGEAVLAAVHDFQPRLPWWLYTVSQARAHLWVMRSFARHLARSSGSPGGQTAPAVRPL